MNAQLTLGLGTTHICRDRTLPTWGCGRAWDCGEPDCLISEHSLGPCCSRVALRHSGLMINRAKREAQQQFRLARIRPDLWPPVAA